MNQGSHDLRLRVVRRHRHMDPTHPQHRLPEMQVLLRQDLRMISTHLDTLERSAGRNVAARNRLLQLLSFDLPPTVLEPENGSYDRLRRAIADDLVALDQVPLRTDGEDPPAGEPLAVARFPWTPIAWPEDLDEAIERRPFERSAAVTDESLWRGYLQNRIREELESRLAAGHRLATVRVEDDQTDDSSKRRVAMARGHLLSRSRVPGLIVFLRLVIGVRARTVKLCLTVPRESRSSWRRPWASAERQLWKHLVRNGPQRRCGPLGAVAGLVAVLERRRRRDPDDLEEPIRLGSLARRRGYTDAERRWVWDRLSEVVDGSGWRELTRSLQLALRTLGRPPLQPQGLDLYGCLHGRLQAYPGVGDLRFVANVAAFLEIETRCGPRFVLAVLDVLSHSHCDEAAGAELRAALDLTSDEVELDFRAVFSCLRERTTSRWAAADALDDLRPLAAISPAHGWTRLINELCAWLAAKIPEVPQAPGEEMRLVREAQRLGELADRISTPRRDRRRLEFFLHPLRASGSARPAGLPGSFWPLLRQWLIGESEDAQLLNRYRIDVGRRFLEAHVRQPAHEALKRCGRWLRDPKPERAVYAGLAHYFVEQIETGSRPGREIRTESALLEGLSLLCAPERHPARPGDDVFDALASSIELAPWRCAAAPGTPEEQQPAAVWRAFVVRLVSESPFAPTSEMRRLWAAWALRSTLRVPSEKELLLWQDHLGRFSRADLAPESWNASLDELESRLGQGAVSGLQRRRIEVMDGWLRSRRGMSAEGDDRWSWIDWALDAHAAGWIDERRAALLHTAALRYPTAPRLEQRIRPLWPGVPVQLLLQNNQPELKRFLDLCRGFGAEWTADLRTHLGSYLSI